MSESSAPEFLFGTLSTPEGRLAAAQRQSLGFYPLSLEEPLDPQPGEPIPIRVRVGADLSLVRVSLFYRLDGTAPDLDHPAGPTQRLELQRSEVRWKTDLWAYGEIWQVDLPPQPEGAFVQYCLLGWDADGQCWPCPSHDAGAVARLPGLVDPDLTPLQQRERHGSPQQYAVGVDCLEPPTWFREAVIYQILVDRFHPGPEGHFGPSDDLAQPLGGTLRGIMAQLDYLCDLGVTCLWLTPIFPCPAYHGYAATDFLGIEPRLGTLSDWQTLVQAAHQRGLRIVLDFVANHLSDQHPHFQQAQQDAGSRYRHWFRFREWPHDYACFFDVAAQPELEVDQPAVGQHLIEAACHWLAQGCDGFRLDYAHGVSHSFWSRFRAAIRQAKADSVSFGEITETPAVIRSFTGRMEGCLDFPLAELLRGCFARDTVSLSEFDRQLQRHLAYFEAGDRLVLPSFLDNHDMNRFLWLAGGKVDRLKLAALCQFTLPGPPILYYGTEVGLSQRRGLGRLEEARLPMSWGAEQDPDLLNFYRRLLALRQQLRPWQFQPLTCLCDDSKGLYLYRIGNSVVCLNRGADKALRLTGLAQRELLFQTSSQIQWQAKQRQLHVPAWSGGVLAVTTDFSVSEG
jgi:glycosidase